MVVSVIVSNCGSAKYLKIKPYYNCIQFDKQSKGKCGAS